MPCVYSLPVILINEIHVLFVASCTAGVNRVCLMWLFAGLIAIVLQCVRLYKRANRERSARPEEMRTGSVGERT